MLQGASQVQRNGAVSLRCPGCRQMGIFDGVMQHDVVTHDSGRPLLAGLRVCPDPNCKTLIFCTWTVSGNKNTIILSYPPQRLNFDAANIPAPISKALEEAITCHAGRCFIAAAIMVRKTLEELCHERGATGATLKERLRNLGTKIVLPRELLEGLDDLRLLGNDAAHIESQEFNTIGQEEIEIGIEFAKEVLKAVFQYSDLLAKLRSLKRA